MDNLHAVITAWLNGSKVHWVGVGTSRSARGGGGRRGSAKHFQRSDGLDTGLYKTYLYLFITVAISNKFVTSVVVCTSHEQFYEHVSIAVNQISLSTLAISFR